MKSKTTSTVKPVIVSFLLLFSFSMMGQVKKAFTPRYSETIKGDVTIIANNVLSRHATNAYNGTDGNHDFSNNVFVDIDSDASTFNSSSANFSNPEPSLSCLNFKKVLLYWAAADKEYSVDDNTGNGGAEPVWNYNQVKLMLPGQSSYSTITADEVIYRGRDEHFVNDPYICVKDITSDVSGLANPYGNFQVANVKATEGDLYSHTGSHTGTSGGWQIVFVYENPSMIGKNITLFDGYVHITQTQGEVEFDFNGFQTVPTGNVNADIVLGSFEGDRDISGDQLQIFDTNSTWSNISTPIRDSNNFFNSRITIDGTDFTDRNPASTNTLGFDAAVFDLQNTGNKFIDNNQTSATLKITSDQESYGLYLLGLSVEVYEPSLGALNFTSSTSGTGFNPGDNVQMTLSVENSGNDDIQNLEIYTTLPQEVDFVNTESLPAGVTYNFNTSTRELRFFVPDGNTDVGDPLYTLDFNVQIKDQCHFLETACSANFAMQATATFSGVTNTNPVVAQSSGTLDSCGIGNFDPTVVDINEPNQVNWSTAANALDTTVSCDDSDALNAAQNLEPATEFCNFTLNKVAGSFVADPSCPGEGTYTNTWTFTDACGRTSDTFTQVITVEDNAAPTFVETLPTDTTVSCDSVPVADVLTATDNCDNSVAVTFDEQITDGDSCPSDYIITRTWSVEDCAGNTTEHVQTITVEDITAPTFVETLPSDTVAAYNAIPSAETLTANDNCDTNAGVSFSETYIGDNTSTTYTIVRTWTASDCTGNSIDHTQQIFVTENGDPVGLYINDITVDEDAGNATLEVFHVGEVIGGFTVNHTTADGTAVESLDYSLTSGTLNFNGTHGELVSISVPINDDNIIEATEAFTVQLSNGSNTPAINDNSGEITINDNDGGAGNGVSVAGFSVNEDAGTADFVLSLNANVQGGFNVDFDVADGTAIAGSDYTVASATGNIAFAGNAGEQHSVTVTILDDTLIENSEDLSITISNLSTGLIGILNANATGTINDNDGGAGNGVSVAGFSVDEDAGTADFVLSLNADVQGGFNVDFDVADGTAIAGSDYTVASATGNIAFAGNAGEQHSVTVTILDDSLIENSEDLTITISNLSTGLISIIDGNATGTIGDNDGGAGNGVSVAGFSVDEDAGTADFVLSLNADVQGGFNVDFAVADGTAIAGSDYTVASATGNIAFAGNAGEQHSVTVTILDDTLIENSEDLTITISNLSTGLIGILNANAVGTINDNDGGAGNGVSVAGFNVDEDAGTADFVLSLNADVQGGFDLDFAVADGTAIAGSDYTVASATGNITFAGNAGEQHSVTVTILDDSLIENSEDLSIALSNLSTGLIGILNANAVGTINDNDGGAGNGVSVAGFSVDEDAGTADFVLSLNADVQGGFNVDFAVADGTAIAGSDYTVASATGNIAFAGNAGEQHSVTVTILDDSLIENSEDLSITISNLSTGLIGILNANATGTINDNDGGAGNGVSVAGFSVDEDAGTADFVLSLNADVQGGFNVDFDVADGTAIAGSDYTVASATGNIAFAGNAGEQHSVTVTILDDSLIENSEDLTITISNLSTGLISIIDGNATGTIGDNDGGAGNGVSVAGFSVDEDAGTADFVLSLNADVQGGFNVDFAVADGTAIAGSDYTVASATGNIAFAGNAGEQHSVTVTILDDTLIENSEDLTITISNLSTGLISIIDGNATGTIGDNDGGAGNGVQFDITNINIDEDAGTVSVPVSLNVDVQDEFTVEFYTTNGSAQDAFDYTGIPQNTQVLTFGAANSNNQNIIIPIIDDIIIESTEDFQVVLTNISTTLVNILANDTATVNIIDNDGNEGYPTDITLEACDTIPTAEVITVNSTCATTVDFNESITGQDDGCAMDYTITRTWTFTDCVGNVREHVQVITVIDTQAPSFVEVLPTDITVSCDNIPVADVLTAIDSCDPNITVVFDEQITDTDSCESNYIITRTWDAADCAGNPISHTQVITVEDTTAPTFVEALPMDVTVSCDAIPTAEILTATDNCDPNITVVFDEQITDSDSCGSDYIITRTWSTADCAGNPVSHTQVITVEDTTAPTFVETLPLDITVSCDNVPTAEILTAMDNCDPSITVVFDEQITDSDSCGSDYIITRTWSTADCAGNPVSHTQEITVEDTQAPQFVENLPQSMTAMCNEVPDAIVLTAIDNCDTTTAVTFDEIITNDSNCATGYTVTRTWSTEDCAGNVNTHTQVITIEPTGPITSSAYEEEINLICGDEIPEVPQLTFMGGCGNYQVEFSEETVSLADTEDFMITRTWDVTDSCGNTASFEQVIFVMQPQPEEVEINICVEDDAINLINYLPESFDTNGVFELISGNVVLDGSIFNPANLEVGEYLISYSSTEGTCKYYVDFTIIVNSDCVPCGRDEIIVSKTVTANGDNINDMFTITGVEYCNYSFELMIFNRWGDKVYESKNYQNDWGGFAPSNAFGNSGMLPSGTYYYIINVINTDIKPLNGYIYLGTGAN
ncbi:Calx-beta domain-containing protein [Flagellimonas sp.]|uniref:Calx-beta domain-containing protein n=1 Tax=Flagellimonas sp. TaxID=2058762 RepID=UPI003B5221D0